MKKTTRTTLAMLLALTALSATLAGCSSGDAGSNTDSTTTAGTTASEVEETTAVTTSSEYKKPGVDLDGEEFIFLDYDTDDYFWQAATYSDIAASEENGDPINDAQFRRNTQVEEELNIKLTSKGMSGVSRLVNAPEYKKLVMAGEDAFDAGFMFLAEAKDIITEPSMSYDFADIPNLDLEASWWNQNFIEEFTIYDRLQMITGDISFFNTISPIHYFYNKPLAEAYDLGDLYQMVRDGEWTNDVMIEMAYKVTSDIDGNGEMGAEDCYGVALQCGMINSYAISSDIHYIERDDEGNIIPTINNAKTVSFVEDMVPFITDKNACMNTMHYSGYSNQFYELHIPTFRDNRMLFNFNQLLIMFEMRAMEADFGILPTPKYDEAQDEYLSDVSGSWATALMVPATNSDVSNLGYVLDALGYYSQQYVTPAFIDVTVLNKAIRDDESAEMLELVLNSCVYDVSSVFNWGTIHTFITNLTAAESTDFASKWASIEPTVNSELATTLEKLKG